MKIKYRGTSLQKDEFLKQLLTEEIILVEEDEDYVVTPSDFAQTTVLGQKDGAIHILEHRDIIYIESFANDIIAHTFDNSYHIKEKLYLVQVLFEPFGFLRVHKSFVVNTHHIKQIIPQFNRKFSLILTKKHKIDVSRSYYDAFKEFMGL